MNKQNLPPINRSEFDAIIFLGQKNKGGFLNGMECHIEGSSIKLTEMLVVAMKKDPQTYKMLLEAILIHKAGLLQIVDASEN